MWTVNVVKNTVKINKECALDLFPVLRYDWEYNEGEEELFVDHIMCDGKIEFNSDHYEHMDFLKNNPKVIDIFKKHKVLGDVIFGDFESNFKAVEKCFWGHRFDGKGGYKKLVAEVSFKEK